MFMTDLGGSLYTGVWTARLTNTARCQGNLTGVAYQTKPTAVAALRITVVVDTSKEKGDGESDVSYTYSEAKMPKVLRSRTAILPDLSDAV